MHDPAYFDSDGCDIANFVAHLNQRTDLAALTFAREVASNIPIYDAQRLDLTGPDRRAIMAEWARVLMSGAGVIVIRRAYADTSPIDAASALFRQIIADEKAKGAAQADHFAAGTNDRVWNSLQKLCLADPALFARYHGNLAINAVAEAWLGPNYQMTAQVNLVYPGGAAQVVHRDYHLGFQTAEQAAAYPAHVHDLSPVMTLQGAIAHCDMPVASGPTQLLPFSQSYRPGYLAYRLPAFRDYFAEHAVQLPLEKGDTLFFNPALFHAAGENRTPDIHRLVNLLQIGSAMGRVLENINRDAMCRALYPVMADIDLSAAQKEAAIAACAEGYPFPTNLDTDPPIGGLAPESQKDLFARALREGLSPDAFGAALDQQNKKKLA